jgi:pilus assembly protein CpaF
MAPALKGLPMTLSSLLSIPPSSARPIDRPGWAAALDQPEAPQPAARGAGASDDHDAAQDRFARIRAALHDRLVRRLDLQALGAMPTAAMRAALRSAVERQLQDDAVALNAAERRRLVAEIQDEMLGLGPLEPLLADGGIADILVNGARQVYVEQHGRLQPAAVRFDDDAHLMRVIDRIVSRVGRRIDESSPMVDARLPDGSRVNAVIPPLALDGPILSIRRFPTRRLALADLVAGGAMTEAMAQWLAALVRARVNLLLSGGTGSGKTTLLNALSAAIPASERVITIEDAAELQLQQPHVVRLETRPPNVEGQGEVGQRALVRNALRMRPDRIILGETRGAEALDMLQAMNTGHEGSMTTLHANTPRDAIARLESLVAMAGFDLPARAARAQIASAIGVVVQIGRLPDGMRRVLSIQEITGSEGEVVSMQEIFAFHPDGPDASGRVRGRFVTSGIRPRTWERLAAHGVPLPVQLFAPGAVQAPLSGEPAGTSPGVQRAGIAASTTPGPWRAAP